MFGPKIRIAPELWEKLTARAETLGYASVQELVTHVLEREVEQMPGETEEEAARKQQLEGLGYLA